MKKLILITGLANGGKTTTILNYLNQGSLSDKTFRNINNHNFAFFETSNCDTGVTCWLEKIYRINKIDNLLGSLCIDVKNEECYLEEFGLDFKIKKLQGLDMDIYFFILPNGKDNRAVDMVEVEKLKKEFGDKKVIISKLQKDNGDSSEELKTIIENITKE